MLDRYYVWEVLHSNLDDVLDYNNWRYEHAFDSPLYDGLDIGLAKNNGLDFASTINTVLDLRTQHW